MNRRYREGAKCLRMANSLRGAKHLLVAVCTAVLLPCSAVTEGQSTSSQEGVAAIAQSDSGEEQGAVYEEINADAEEQSTNAGEQGDIDGGEGTAVALDATLIDGIEETVYTEDKSPVHRANRSTAEELRNTGRQLALNGEAGGKYLAAQYMKDGRRRADVIFIANSANVTTTRCLFLIVAGYLEATSPLTAEAAYNDAEKICWWNSAHYGDAAYFGQLTGGGALPLAERTEAIGLSPSYKDWAGKSRIVIPWAIGAVKSAAAGSDTEGGDGAAITVDVQLVSNGAGDNADNAAEASRENAIEYAEYRPKKESASSNTLTETTVLSEHLSLPSGFFIMLAAVSLAIVTLVFLLIKLIMDLARDRG